jgi:preprotein translocase subunit YajC
VTIAASGGSGFFLIIIVAFLLLWLIVVRPQRRRQNQQQQMLGDLRVGDEVLTAGGIYGTVLQLEEDQVTVEIAPNVEVQVARRAIAGVTHEDEPEPEDTADGSEQDDDPSGGIPENEASNEEKRG